MDLFPAELLYKIFGLLEREDKLSCSRVNIYWRAVIHSVCWPILNSKIQNGNFTHHQLSSWGWKEESHNYLSCNCVDIVLNFQPFRSSTPIRIQEIRAGKEESIHTTCAITSNKVFVGSSRLTDASQKTTIQVFDRTNTVTSSVTFKTFEEATEVHLYSYENTLVLLERRTQENLLTSVISVNNFKISIWNSETFEFIQYIDFLEKIQDIPKHNVHTEISDVAIVKDTLAIHVFVTNLDWLLPEEIVQNPQSKNITLFWSLDTDDPSVSNILFRTLIRKNLVEGNICDTGFIFLNQSFFLRYLSGLYASDSRPKFASKIQVFQTNDLAKAQPWIVDVNQSDVLDFGDCNDDSLKLEPGFSSRIATFNVYNSSFKILDIKQGQTLLYVDMSPRAGMSPLFSVWQMYDANWIGGNFMFVKDVSLLNNKKKTLQVIVVTDDSSRSDSLPHYPHFLKGSTISPVLEVGDILAPGTRVHVDTAGIVIVSEEFILNASFNSSH